MKKPKIKKLKNGLRIVTVPSDSPSTTVMVLVGTGSRYEDKSKNGISHFLEHMCFKGTSSKTGKEIMRYLDGLGAETNAFTSYELTGYYVKSITKHWKKALRTVSDIYLNSTFPEDEMQREKGVILGEISMYEDMPMRHIHDLFPALVHGDQPAGRTILGPRKNIKAMKRQHFLDYHDKHYVALNTVIVVAGNVDSKAVVSEVSELFANIKTTRKKKMQKATIKQSKPQLLLHNKKTDQTHMILGYRSTSFRHKDALTLKLLGAVLGGGMSSRLFEKLREDMGVGYYVRAGNSTQSDLGMLQVSCGVDSKRVTEVLTAIQSEMLRIRNELVPEEELRKTKEYIIGNTQMGLEGSDELGYYYAQRELFDLPTKTPAQFARDINAISAADIRRVAKKVIKAQGLNVAMIGPHGKKDEKEFKKAMKI